jgi:hypothetical protein
MTSPMAAFHAAARRSVDRSRIGLAAWRIAWASAQRAERIDRRWSQALSAPGARSAEQDAIADASDGQNEEGGEEIQRRPGGKEKQRKDAYRKRKPRLK